LLLVATFDEDSGTKNNHIYTALWGPAVKPGTQLSERYDHYSLLRTMEDALGVGTLGQQDEAAAAITGWR
jgi:acid phosphatase